MNVTNNNNGETYNLTGGSENTGPAGLQEVVPQVGGGEVAPVGANTPEGFAVSVDADADTDNPHNAQTGGSAIGQESTLGSVGGSPKDVFGNGGPSHNTGTWNAALTSATS